MIRKTVSKPLKFYQKYLTLLGFGSCRYYPTCSEYAKWQIETNPSLPKALLSSFLRILRCNQLFPGGIDYPTVSCRHIEPSRQKPKTEIRYWYVPGKDGCKVIKNIFSKGPTC
ncbi:membrane protein insertion efficiency factor YidD [Hydrogenimonas sp. SS33]|uniref:membrane protein insertion efficiency factor YidD n=1 Tax=Hydrogenimonas leucolamina TaxID=2954236 RepID=UPI00336C1761